MYNTSFERTAAARKFYFIIIIHAKEPPSICIACTQDSVTCRMGMAPIAIALDIMEVFRSSTNLAEKPAS